ncbi:conserved hypothetical protein [Haloarcula hispanica ATCC 33960]|uniref:Uncharacterized protein n=1 Tax=Haloarcula hispanica (strain ATCC 33960 / DSM 4426 / JCM 8911 / NBRC 102182 / NCIMB 2187 / VKM B-1755) TaxID=634497 RepID=G0HZ96_HALHT|nr:conserved hypothetical protein [Haloarcula hispanica ATCC 33960]
MTGNDLPANPSVLNTTVLSNFAYIDQLWIVADLSGICTVPVVRGELEHGVANTHIFRKHSIRLMTKSQLRRFRILSQTEKPLLGASRSWGAQAFALADAHDG